jgi:flagellar basal-body rod modification protein FlgD
MADETNNNGIGGIGGTNSTAATGSITGKRPSEQINKDEFLQLLVTQLKNQDPLDPMNSEQFAVNLAQFSQLEQLISINDKIGGSGTELTSMAAYLGHEVTLAGDTLQVQNGDGGRVKFNLEEDASQVQVELLDANGAVRDTKVFADLKAGKQSLELSGLNVQSGEFKVRVTAAGVNGGTSQPAAQIAGIVSGFVPGPEPVLMVGGREVSPSEVIEVSIPK